MAVKVVGKCSNCGGNVIVPLIWHGIFPPEPYCTNCRATSKQTGLPVIPMNKSPRLNKR